MKTKFTLLIFFCFSLQFVSSQGLINSSFSIIETINCPFDNTIQIDVPQYWKIYQTQNGQWDGPIDSTKCISTVENSFYLDIPLNQIDPNQPLFIKSDVEDPEIRRLLSNKIFRATFDIRVTEGVSVNLEEDCENNLCSGLFVGIEIPDSSNQETVLREFKGTTNLSFSGENYYGLTLCYPTEKFDTSYLQEFILKLTFEDSIYTDETISLNFAENYESEETWGDYRIYDIQAPDWTFQDTSYELSLYDLANSIHNFLLMYADTTYPSPAYPSFIDARPFNNLPDQQTINLKIEQQQTLVFQPYAFIRGGLVEGSDSIRHEFNLINQGGNMCFQEFLEVVFSGNNTFFYQSGDITFHGSASCMLFRRGGELKVDQNAYLQYGDGGEGILGLGERAQINLDIGSTLHIDNKVVLLDIVNNFDQEIKVDLQPGSALIFGENASIIQASGSQGNQIINVYMNGGLLDDHNLSEIERSMINKIYPDSTPPSNKALLIYPNPVENILTARFNSPLDQDVNVDIINSSGQLIYSKKQSLLEGINDLVININTTERGLFILRIKAKNEIISTKFVR